MSDKLDKYNCQICQCVLEEPVMITKCFHTFCMKCISSLINSQHKANPNVNKISCPLCREEFGKEDYVLAYDLQMEIENCKAKCKCGLEIPIRLFEDHQENCGNNKKKDGTIIGDYNCTLCPKTQMNREQYVKHIEETHSEEEGVCAICSVQPWGDKNYKTFLLGHVDLRHKKKDVSFNDQNKEELELIKLVMEKSLTEK